MKGFIRLLCMLWAACTWAASAVQNQDIDVFLTSGGTSTDLPNVLIVLDNTANWNTPFTSEKTALVSLFNSLQADTFNVGLMMFTETGGANGTIDGGYVRYAVRQMNSSNKTTLAGIVNGLNVNSDKSNGGKLGQTMREAYLYFGGQNAYSGLKVKTDSGAFTTSPTYRSPASGACQRNFVIFINNGPVQDNTSDTTSATSALSAAGGNTTTIPLSPSGSQSNIGDEWARFMNGVDLNSSFSGTQNITTYTIEVQPISTGQGPGMTALLKSMASVGGGRYIAIQNPTNPVELQKVLDDIFKEIQAVNSVFASSTLPVSVNTRSTNLNQVYMGVFRPDANDKPRWVGNLKQFQLALDTSTGQGKLVDKVGADVTSPTTGFILPTAKSFWTHTSTFWNATAYPDSQGSGGTSDLPDGDLVEKGGVAQHMREQSSRALYTCLSCSGGASLSASGNLFATGNGALTTTMLGVSTSTDRTNLINWVTGLNVQLDDPTTGTASSRRGFVHGDVVHSRPVVINYNRSGQPSGRDIMVYYGANDGWLHAAKGGNDDADGDEKWAFIPQEMLGGFKRLYDNSPVMDASNTKGYFFDGPIGYYLKDANGDKRFDPNTSGDLVYVYPTARRGGRMIYGLNVTDPLSPTFLWKHTNADTGFAELGQTWSEPRPAKLAGYANQVLIFGAGYDAAANDASPATTATMGRGVFVVDAITGALVWKAVSASVSSDCSGSSCTKVSGMDYSVPGDVAVIDRDRNGYVDKLYFADTGGNIWRVDVGDDPSATSPSFTVNKLATLGGTGSSARKFLFAPDVVLEDSADTLLLGSGDREKPFSMTVNDLFFGVKDPGVGKSNTVTTPIVLADLYDATANLVQQGTAAQKSAALSSLASAKGWYVKLNGHLTQRDLDCGKSSGEKVVSGAITVGGAVYFGTHIPNYSYSYADSSSCTATLTFSNNSCTYNLGSARVYTVGYANGSAIFDQDSTVGLTSTDRYREQVGGGLPPTPVVANVELNGKLYNLVISGTKVFATPSFYKSRTRVYWYELRN